MHGINQYLEACYYRESFLQDQMGWLHFEKAQHAKEIEGLESVLVRTRREFGGYLIPEVSDDYLEGLESRLSCYGLIDTKREYEDLFAVVEERTEELEGMDEIQNYDARISVANAALDEVRPEHTKQNAAMRYWSNSKWFESLNRRGYFEEKYQPWFFNRFFDWRAVSFLMSDLEENAKLKFDEPEPLRAHFRKLRADADAINEVYNERLQQVTRIGDLHSEYQDLLARPEQLLAELYQALGEKIITHLEACPNEMRMRLAAEDVALNKYLQLVIGVRKQIQYLRELSITRLDSRIDQTQIELDKSRRKIEKLRLQKIRGKYKRFSDDDIERMRNVKQDKWNRRRLKTEKLRKRISEFDRHEHGSCSDDYLWWDLITKGSNGDDLFEVQEHRRNHPDWDYRTYKDSFTTNYDEPLWDDAAEDLASSMSARDDDFFDGS